jgi:hypothetical protein
LDEVDESATGSATLWSRSAILSTDRRCASLWLMDARDEQILSEALFEIRDGVREVLRLLGEDEDEEEEEGS